MRKNISVIWDFDKTLTPIDSTSKTVEIIGKNADLFWEDIQKKPDVFLR